MNIGRAYHASTLLSDGRAFVLGGSWAGGLGGKHAEIWQPSDNWELLPNVKVDEFIGNDPAGVYRADNHMWLFAQSNGKVFHAGPSVKMHWIDTNGTGSFSDAGNRGNDTYAINGSAVMYDIGKILVTGGAPAYEGQPATTNAHIIDISDGINAQVSQIQHLKFSRGFHYSVALPNGQVVVLGGMGFLQIFADTGARLVPELFDPITETFTNLKASKIPRTYHSTALLLTDGRVLVGGGGLCGGCSVNHFDYEILTPPYLLNSDGSEASRPSIINAPTAGNLNTSITVTTDQTISSFSLMRMGSATHSVNNDQRRVPVQFTDGGANSYSLSIPADPGIVLPGYYMLFAMNTQGVPSRSAIIKIN